MRTILQQANDLTEKWGVTPKLVLDITPNTAPRMVASDRYRHRACVDRYNAYKTEVRLKTSLANYELSNILDICFVMPMYKTYTDKQKELMYLTYHKRTPDRDNLLKAFQDSFNIDDSHVCDGRTFKVWGYVGCIIIF